MRRNLIAKIHIAKKQLGLDQDVYREVLSHIANGKTSCADMDEVELKKVLAHFHDRGFKAKAPKHKRRMSPPSGQAKIAEIDKIRAIWITMAQHGLVRDNSEAALDAYVKRMTAKFNKGKGIESVKWLTHVTAEQVLEVLKQWHKRILADRLISIGVSTIDTPKGEKDIKAASYDYVTYTYKFWQKRGKL